MKLKLLSLVAMIFTMQVVIAQRTVTGVVTETGTDLPLIGANVIVAGTSTGTVTDVDGSFSLSVPSDVTNLEISYTGYTTQIVSIENLATINVILEVGQLLDEVVVTALGVEEKRSRLSYSTQKVGASDLNVSRIGDVSQQLSGLVPGLQVTTGNGSGLSSSRIVLRGESSLNINKNQPLIVVDGVVVSNNLDGIGGGSTSWSNAPIDFGNGLTDFNTDDIEDVTVLKGPKAAALYGARAANGALVIRTKSGAAKKGMGIEFNTGVSMDVLGNFWDEQTQYGGGFNNEFRVDWGGNYGAPTNGQSVEQPTANQFYAGVSVPASSYTKRLDRRGFFDTGVAIQQ